MNKQEDVVIKQKGKMIAVNDKIQHKIQFDQIFCAFE